MIFVHENHFPLPFDSLKLLHLVSCQMFISSAKEIIILVTRKECELFPFFKKKYQI